MEKGGFPPRTLSSLNSLSRQGTAERTFVPLETWYSRLSPPNESLCISLRTTGKSTRHCYEVSHANTDGTIIADDHVVDYGVLPAVLSAVTGQQAVGNTAWVYAYNNTAEYEVVPDHTIVACGVPVMESADFNR